MPEITDEDRKREVERLRALAAEIKAKIPNYEQHNPKLAREALATANTYLATAKKIERQIQ